MQNSTNAKIKDSFIVKWIKRIGKLSIFRIGIFELLIIIGLIGLVFKYWNF